MTEPKVGSKFIIEIEEVYNSNSDIELTPKTLYRIKGSNLIIDKQTLAKLISLEEYNLQILTEIMSHFTKSDS